MLTLTNSIQSKFVKEQDIEEISMRNVVIMLFVVRNWHVFDKFLRRWANAYESIANFTCTRLSVNNSKIKIMLVKCQNKNKAWIMYNNEPWKALNTLLMKLPKIIDRKNEYATHWLG